MFGYLKGLLGYNEPAVEVIKSACQQFGEQIGSQISQFNVTDFATQACELGEEYGVDFNNPKHQLAIGAAALTTAIAATTLVAYGISRACRRSASKIEIPAEVVTLTTEIKEKQKEQGVEAKVNVNVVEEKTEVANPIAQLNIDVICTAFLKPEAKAKMRKDFANPEKRAETIEYVRTQLDLPADWKVDRTNDVLVRKVNAIMDNLQLRDHRLQHVDLRQSAIAKCN